MCPLPLPGPDPTLGKTPLQSAPFVRSDLRSTPLGLPEYSKTRSRIVLPFLPQSPAAEGVFSPFTQHRASPPTADRQSASASREMRGWMSCRETVLCSVGPGPGPICDDCHATAPCSLGLPAVRNLSLLLILFNRNSGTQPQFCLEVPLEELVFSSG